MCKEAKLDEGRSRVSRHPRSRRNLRPRGIRVGDSPDHMNAIAAATAAIVLSLRSDYGPELITMKTRLPELAEDVDKVYANFDAADQAQGAGDIPTAMAAIDKSKAGYATIKSRYTHRVLELKTRIDEMADDISELRADYRIDGKNAMAENAEDAYQQFVYAEMLITDASTMLDDEEETLADVVAKMDAAKAERINGFRYLGGALPPDMKKKERRAHKAALANGDFLPDAPAPDDWANGVVELYDIKDNRDQHSVDIHLTLKPTEYLKYFSLQNQMAAKIPPENWRPTIWVTVKGSKAPSSSFGIIGGTGPLSDAIMLKATMENLQQTAKDAALAAELDGSDPEFTMEHVHVRLLSAPPPREGDKPEDDGKKGKKKFLTPKYDIKMVRYLKRAAKFSNMDHYTMSLASNTAHGNLGKAKGMRRVGAFARRGEEWSDEKQVQDLAGKVVEKVLLTPNAKPLILGTEAAYNVEAQANGDPSMYGGFFADHSDGATSTAEVTPEKAHELQVLIDIAKGGGADDKLKKQLQQEVLREMARQRDEVGTAPTHIILGCTELPLGLGGHKGIHELEKLLAKNGFPGVEIIDTEAFFAAEYTNMILKGAGTPVIETTPAKDTAWDAAASAWRAEVTAFHGRVQRYVNELIDSGDEDLIELAEEVPDLFAGWLHDMNGLVKKCSPRNGILEPGKCKRLRDAIAKFSTFLTNDMRVFALDSNDEVTVALNASARLTAALTALKTALDQLTA